MRKNGGGLRQSSREAQISFSIILETGAYLGDIRGFGPNSKYVLCSLLFKSKTDRTWSVFKGMFQINVSILF